MNDVAHRIRNQGQMPTLPAVVARLISTLSNENYTIHEITTLIESDPSLAGRIVRLANSAYYGFQGQIDAVTRALVLVGSATVQAVALGSSVLKAWSNSTIPPQVEELWRRSFLCASGCRHLALRLPENENRASPDGLFLLGLLHDIGKIFFLAQEPTAYAKILESAGSIENLCALENNFFGEDHAEAGSELLKTWNLPAWMAAVVKLHHKGTPRAELIENWRILKTVNAAITEGDSTAAEHNIPSKLIADMLQHIEVKKDEAKAFYSSISQ